MWSLAARVGKVFMEILLVHVKSKQNADKGSQKVQNGHNRDQDSRIMTPPLPSKQKRDDRPGVTLIAAWRSDQMPSKRHDKIIYPFLNFISCTVGVWEWTSYFVSHFTVDVITYSSLN